MYHSYMRLAHKKKGFTLIELLIVVSIITIISGAVIPGFSNYIAHQNVIQSLEKVIDDIRTVQNKALSGELSNTVISSNKPEYWGIQYTQNATTYNYFVSYDKNSCLPSEYSNQGVSKPLPGGMLIRSASKCVFFDFGSANTYSSGSATIIVGPENVNTGCLRVELNAVGLVQKVENSTCN